MLLNNKTVAIIGGGPGGLMLARLLQQRGIDVTVYERDADRHFRQQGATLDLHYESGLKALRLGGLMEQFREHYRPGAERVTIVDNHAKPHYSESGNQPLTDLDSIYARPEIDRGPLRDLLIDSLRPGTIVWDCKFAELVKQGEGWEIRFSNGTRAYADFVIGSDGANTRVRKYVTDIPRLYSGYSITEGNVYNAAVNAPKLWALTNGGKIFAHWNRKTIVLSAKGEGSLSFYTITQESEDWASSRELDFTQKTQVFDWFKDRFSDWGEEWHEIFDTDDSYFVHRPQYYYPVDQVWQAQSNITLIGDAAHQTPPSGDGVNQAMLDAVEFMEAITDPAFRNLTEAIAHYEQRMLARTAIATTEALEMSVEMTAENNLEIMLNFFQTKDSAAEPA